MAKKDMAETIRARIGPGHEDLKEKFIPKCSPGCRRMTVGKLTFESLMYRADSSINLAW